MKLSPESLAGPRPVRGLRPRPCCFQPVLQKGRLNLGVSPFDAVCMPRKIRPNGGRQRAALNGLLNVAWTLLFFRLHRPDWALYELLALWSSIAVLIVLTGRIATAAGWLLVPYLAWVTFAGVLNAMVVRLNGPFG